MADLFRKIFGGLFLLEDCYAQGDKGRPEFSDYSNVHHLEIRYMASRRVALDGVLK